MNCTNWYEDREQGANRFSTEAKEGQDRRVS